MSMEFGINLGMPSPALAPAEQLEDRRPPDGGRFMLGVGGWVG
jgi:hypothetical protein